MNNSINNYFLVKHFVDQFQYAHVFASAKREHKTALATALGIHLAAVICFMGAFLGEIAALFYVSIALSVALPIFCYTHTSKPISFIVDQVTYLFHGKAIKKEAEELRAESKSGLLKHIDDISRMMNASNEWKETARRAKIIIDKAA